MILGGRDSGKTATMCNIFSDFHRDKTDVALIAPKQVCKAYPRWVKCVNPEKLNVPGDSVVGVDDAHLYFYSRDWAKDREKHKVLDFLARESYHKDITFIYTTQQARVLDINLVGSVDLYIIKKYPKRSAEFERREIRETIKKANEALKGKGKKYAFVTNEVEKVVGPYDLPSWWSSDIRKSYRGKTINIPTDYKWIGDLVRDSVRLIKRLPI